jgi:hypothetical protein
MKNSEAVLQHSIFFVTYKWSQKVSVFDNGKPFQPSVMQHSSLLGQFVMHEENDLL